MNRSNRRRLAMVSLAVYWVVFLMVFHWPLPFVPDPSVSQFDKVVHALIYGGLAAMVLVVLQVRRERLPNSLGALVGQACSVGLCVVLHGYFDEVTQPLSNRTYDLWDWAADAVGVGCAIALWVVWAPVVWVNRDSPS